MPLDPKTTISTNLHRFENAELFMRGVLQHVHFAKGIPETAHVRLGILGSGRWPNYRIERSGFQHMCFDGRTHKLIFDNDSLCEVNWSRETISVADLLVLLSKVMPRRAKWCRAA